MQRIIFCPNESLLDEARILSKKNGLPIVIGDNESTNEIDFDRATVAVVLIPERDEIFFNPHVKRGLHQIIIYNNEFVTSDNIDIKIKNLNLIEVYKEKYRSKYAAPCTEVGKYFGEVYKNSILERTFEFVVN
jgi:hypothetical protein